MHHASVAAAVVTDAALLRRIAAFQDGVSMAVYAFRVSPEAMYVKLRDLPAAIVEHGSPHLLDLLLATQGGRQVDYDPVIPTAIVLAKPHVLLWAMRHEWLNSKHTCKYFSVAMESYSNGGAELLEALKTCDDLPSVIPSDVLKSNVVYPSIKDMALVHWLQSNLPHLESDPYALLETGVHAGNLEIIQYVFEHYPATYWGAEILKLESPHSMIAFETGTRPLPGYYDSVQYLFKHHSTKFRASTEELITAIRSATESLLDVMSSVEVVKEAMQAALPTPFKPGDAKAIQPTGKCSSQQINDRQLTARSKPTVVSVLTMHALLCEITSFQCGVPIALADLWHTHAPPDKKDKLMAHVDQLPYIVATHGTVTLLELTRRVRIPKRFFIGSSRWVALNYVNVSDAAIARYDIAMLQWAMDNGYVDGYSSRRLFRAVLKRYTDSQGTDTEEGFALFDILREYFSTTVPGNFLQLEYLSPDLQDVRLIDRLRTELPHLDLRRTGIIETAAATGNLEVVKYMHTHFPDDEWSLRRLCVTQVLPGYKECLQYLTSHWLDGMAYPLVYIPYYLNNCGEQLLAIVKELHLFESQVCDTIQRVVDAGNLQRVQLFYECGYLSPDAPVGIDQCCSVDVVCFLMERGVAVATTDAMDVAAEHGRWDIVRYLHMEGAVDCTTRVMDAAAAQRRLDQVRFLHQHRTEGCSSKALDSAAANGDLDMVVYLHEQGGASCTQAALSSAVMNGDMRLVTYLLEHMNEGCTVEAMDEAARRGHLHVLELLYQCRAERCSVGVQQDARVRHHEAVVEFLHHHDHREFRSEQR